MKGSKKAKETSSREHDHHLGPKSEEKKVSGAKRGRGFTNLANLIHKHEPRSRRSNSLPPPESSSPPPSKQPETITMVSGKAEGGANNGTNNEKTLQKSESDIACPHCKKYFDLSKIIQEFPDKLKKKVAAKQTEVAPPNTPPPKISGPANN